MIRKRLASCAGGLRRLLSDDRGAEGLEKLLIIAAVVLPLLGILIFYGGEIRDWLSDMWSDVQSDSQNLTP